MKTLSRFVTKFTSLIVAVLSCFDRVIFKGHLPISNGPALEGFVDHVLKIRRCDFMAFAEEKSETLVNNAKRLAQEAGVEYRFLQGSHHKNKLVDQILRQGRRGIVKSCGWENFQAAGFSLMPSMKTVPLMTSARSGEPFNARQPL